MAPKVTAISSVTFTAKELQSLLDDPQAHVHLKQKVKYPIRLLPSNLNDVNSAIIQILNSHKMTYLPRYEGILLSYKNIKRLGDIGTITNDDCHINIALQIDLYIFTPKVNCILRGYVNKKSEDNIGCIVHKGFNVALPRPNATCSNDWPGNSVHVGQEVLIRVDLINIKRTLPYIRGRFLNESELEEEGIERQEPVIEPSTVQDMNDLSHELKRKKKKKKDKHQESEEDNPIDVIEESLLLDEGKLKKKSKKKKRAETSTINDDVEDAIDSIPEHMQVKDFGISERVGSEADMLLTKKKKKRSKKDSESEQYSFSVADIGQQVDESAVVGVNNARSPSKAKKKTKQRKESESEDHSLAVADVTQRLEESVLDGITGTGSPSKKKNQSKRELESDGLVVADAIKIPSMEGLLAKYCNKIGIKIEPTDDSSPSKRKKPNSTLHDTNFGSVSELDPLSNKNKKRSRKTSEALDNELNRKTQKNTDCGAEESDIVQTMLQSVKLDLKINSKESLKHRSTHLGNDPAQEELLNSLIKSEFKAKKKSRSTFPAEDLYAASSSELDPSTSKSKKKSRKTSEALENEKNRKSENIGLDFEDFNTDIQAMLNLVRSDLDIDKSKSMQSVSDPVVDVKNKLFNSEVKNTKKNKTTIKSPEIIAQEVVNFDKSELHVKDKTKSKPEPVEDFRKRNVVQQKSKKAKKNNLEDVPSSIRALLESAKSKLMSDQSENESDQQSKERHTISNLTDPVPSKLKIKNKNKSTPELGDTENIARALLASAISSVEGKKSKPTKSVEPIAVPKSRVKKNPTIGKKTLAMIRKQLNIAEKSSSSEESSSDDHGPRLSKTILTAPSLQSDKKSPNSSSSDDEVTVPNQTSVASDQSENESNQQSKGRHTVSNLTNPVSSKLKIKKKSTPELDDTENIARALLASAISSVEGKKSKPTKSEKPIAIPKSQVKKNHTIGKKTIAMIRKPLNNIAEKSSSSDESSTDDHGPRTSKTILTAPSLQSDKKSPNSSSSDDEVTVPNQASVAISKEKQPMKNVTKTTVQEDVSNSDDDFVTAKVKQSPQKKTKLKKSIITRAPSTPKTTYPGTSSSEDKAAKERTQNIIRSASESIKTKPKAPANVEIGKKHNINNKNSKNHQVVGVDIQKSSEGSDLGMKLLNNFIQNKSKK